MVVSKRDSADPGTDLSTTSMSDRDYALWVLLSQARRAMLRAREQELARTSKGVTPRESHLLQIIHVIGERVTTVDVARHALLELHSVSEQLTRMEKKGLVKRVRMRNPVDGKRQIIVLTEKGIDALGKCVRRESLARIFSFMTEADRHSLFSLLTQIRTRALQEIGANTNVPYPRSE